MKFYSSFFIIICIYTYYVLGRKTIHEQSPRPGRGIVIRITKSVSNIFLGREAEIQ